MKVPDLTAISQQTRERIERGLCAIRENARALDMAGSMAADLIHRNHSEAREALQEVVDKCLANWQAAEDLASELL